MKINKYIFILFISVLLIQQGCKKDYPKDIPDWLKTMIKEREKECKNDKCYCKTFGVGCQSIGEYEYMGETYFMNHSYADAQDYYIIYDINGNVYCQEIVTFSSIFIVCPDFFANKIYIRKIWDEGGN